MKSFFGMKSSMALSAVAGGFLALAAPAHAAFLNSPVPSNAYIVYAGLDWAWGNPCPDSGGCGGADLSYQSTQGWRLPTAAEMGIVDALDASNSAAFADLFYGTSGNVPSGGSDPVSGAYFNDGSGGSCASPYFSTNWHNCDATDGNAGAWNGSVRGANYAGFGNFYDEQLYVRGAISGVPEPGTWLMMLAGFGVMGFAFRHRRQPKVQTKVRYTI